MSLKNMSKEELELLSYTKIAEMLLKEEKKTMSTANIFKSICNLLELSETEYQEKIADFFQSLATSKEFILLEDGNWDLRVNHSVKVIIDDEEEIDEIDKEEILDDEEETEEFDLSEDEDYEEDDLNDLSIIGEDEIEE